MSCQKFFKCEITPFLGPYAHNIIDVLILALVLKTYIASLWINIKIKNTESNLKLQLILSKFFCAQSILYRVLIELSVFVVAHDDELIYAIKCNN